MKKIVIAFWGVLNAFFDGFWDLLCRGHVMRRVAFVFMLVLTWKVYTKILEIPLDTADIDQAAYIAALLTPLSGLQAAFVKFYNDGRYRQKEQQNAKPSDT